MIQPSDDRLGIVRLPLPDGREVVLQWTYAALDRIGHVWVSERFVIAAKGREGSLVAVAELLEAATNGGVKAEDVIKGGLAAYPLVPCSEALWRSWELAKFGPKGEVADDSDRPLLIRLLIWLVKRFG